MKKAIVVFLLVLLPGVAVAQQPPPQGGGRPGFFGVRGGLFYEDWVGHGPLVGIEVGIPIGSDRLILNPNAELAVVDSYVAALSGDVIYYLTPRSRAQLWIGAGVGYLNESGFFRRSQSGLF